MKTLTSSLIIIPTYNEATNLPTLLPEIWRAAPAAHVLIVDDKSPDGTAQVIKKLQKEHAKSLFLLERSGKNGLGTAYLAGFRWALERNYTNVIQMDADFSHDPKILPLMIRSLAQNPVVIGSRYTSGGGTTNWSLIRKMISKVGSWYARTLLNVKIHDFTGGFNGWRDEVLRKIDLSSIKSQGYTFQIELKYKAACCDFKLTEIPIIFNERRSGQSKMSFKIILEAILAVWRLRWEKRLNEQA